MEDEEVAADVLAPPLKLKREWPLGKGSRDDVTDHLPLSRRVGTLSIYVVAPARSVCLQQCSCFLHMRVSVASPKMKKRPENEKEKERKEKERKEKEMAARRRRSVKWAAKSIEEKEEAYKTALELWEQNGKSNAPQSTATQQLQKLGKNL